jgi:hypothetical protein
LRRYLIPPLSRLVAVFRLFVAVFGFLAACGGERIARLGIPIT